MLGFDPVNAGGRCLLHEKTVEIKPSEVPKLSKTYSKVDQTVESTQTTTNSKPGPSFDSATKLGSESTATQKETETEVTVTNYDESVVKLERPDGRLYELIGTANLIVTTIWGDEFVFKHPIKGTFDGKN